MAGTPKYTNKVSFPVTVYRSSTTPLDCPSQGLVINGGPATSPDGIRSSPARSRSPRARRAMAFLPLLEEVVRSVDGALAC